MHSPCLIFFRNLFKISKLECVNTPFFWTPSTNYPGVIFQGKISLLIVLGGILGQLSRVVIVQGWIIQGKMLGVKRPGGNCPGWSFMGVTWPGGKLFRGNHSEGKSPEGNFLGENFIGVVVLGVVVQGDNFPREKVVRGSIALGECHGGQMSRGKYLVTTNHNTMFFNSCMSHLSPFPI